MRSFGFAFFVGIAPRQPLIENYILGQIKLQSNCGLKYGIRNKLSFSIDIDMLDVVSVSRVLVKVKD